MLFFTLKYILLCVYCRKLSSVDDPENLNFLIKFDNVLNFDLVIFDNIGILKRRSLHSLEVAFEVR